MKSGLARSVCGLLGVSILAASQALADPNPVDFTSTGLAPGSINGQEFWSVSVQAPANGGFVVVPGKGLELTDNTGGSHAASYAFQNDNTSPLGRDSFASDTPITTTINFSVVTDSSPKKGRIVGIGWGLFVPVSLNSLPFFAEFSRDSEAGGYRLRFVKESDKTVVEGETSVVISDADLGISADKRESDPLQLSLTQTNVAEPTSWNTVSMLTNLKTKKTFVLKNTITAPGVYKTDDFIRAVVNLRRAGEDGLSSVVISQLDADPAVDPTSQ